MNCSVRLKTNEMDLALLLAAGVATRHNNHQQQQHNQQHQQHLITNTTTITTATTTAATTTLNTNNNNNSTQQHQQQTQNLSQFDHGASSMFEQRTTPVPNAMEMIRSTSPTTTVNDSTQYLRASSVSLQSQAATTGGGGGATSRHQQQQQHHLQFSDSTNSTQNTTPRAVDNQYSFV